MDGGEGDRLDGVLDTAGAVLHQAELLVRAGPGVVKGHVGSVLVELHLVRGGVVVLGSHDDSLQFDIAWNKRNLLKSSDDNSGEVKFSNNL